MIDIENFLIEIDQIPWFANVGKPRPGAPPLGCHAGKGKFAMHGIAALDNKCKDRRSGQI